MTPITDARVVGAGERQDRALTVGCYLMKRRSGLRGRITKYVRQIAVNRRPGASSAHARRQRLSRSFAGPHGSWQLREYSLHRRLCWRVLMTGLRVVALGNIWSLREIDCLSKNS
jgi:hypothetical protein